MKTITYIVFAIALALLGLLMFLLRGKDDKTRTKALCALSCVNFALMLGLILMGAMTASTRSGMAYLDWPTSGGQLYPAFDTWIGTNHKFWEHGHRLMGQLVGYFSIAMVLVALTVKSINYKRHSLCLFAIVCIQGVMGGVTVFRNTHWLTSAIHGTLAQVCFCVLLWMIVRSAKFFPFIEESDKRDDFPQVMKFAKVTSVVLFFQLLLGATFRHKMKVFGTNEANEVVYKEDFTNHMGWFFAHLGFAVPAVICTIVLGIFLMKKAKHIPYLRVSGMMLHGSVVLQVLLGLVAVFTVMGREKGKSDQVQSFLTSMHLVNGAVLLALAVVSFLVVRYVLSLDTSEKNPGKLVEGGDVYSAPQDLDAELVDKGGIS